MKLTKKNSNILPFLNRPAALLTDNNEEPHNPLKTNLSANGIEVFLIEDGIKSSKDKVTDGRLSSMGNEIFASRKPTVNQSLLKENKSPSKAYPLKGAFNSTPNIVHKSIQTQPKKQKVAATHDSMYESQKFNDP
jgi:hypothetical protein